MACLVWYSTVTVYVGIRGALDIKHMLARLRAAQVKDHVLRYVGSFFDNATASTVVLVNSGWLE